jgi:hypothetical protein
MRVQQIAISHIKLNPRNARTHSAKQLRQIANSMVAFGFTNPLLVSEDGELIAGHGRYAAAKLLGLAEVPVIVVAGLSPAKRRALSIADNKIAANAGWDRKRLAIEIPELTAILSTEGLDISILGFEKIEIDKIINIDCEPKAAHRALNIDPKWFKAPTVWLLGEHKLVCGETRSTADIEAVIRNWQTFSRRTAIHAETGLSFNEIATDQKTPLQQSSKRKQ